MGEVGDVGTGGGDDDQLADGDDDDACPEAPEAVTEGDAACADGVKSNAKRFLETLIRQLNEV